MLVNQNWQNNTNKKAFLDKQYRLQIQPLTRELSRLDTQAEQITDNIGRRYQEELKIFELQLKERDRIQKSISDLFERQEDIVEGGQELLQNIAENPVLYAGITN